MEHGCALKPGAALVAPLQLLLALGAETGIALMQAQGTHRKGLPFGFSPHSKQDHLPLLFNARCLLLW